VDELGCTTTQGMEGVYCVPHHGSDGKADWNKSVGYCSLVPLNTDGALFQAMIVLMVGYAEHKRKRTNGVFRRGAARRRECCLRPRRLKSNAEANGTTRRRIRCLKWLHLRKEGHVWRQEKLSLRRPRLHHLPLPRRVWFFRTLSALTQCHQQEHPLCPPRVSLQLATLQAHKGET
jgi:hypothetical protein